MLKLALYGKGGIGKSTTCANLSLALTELGLRVMQIGCDPKADSTASLHPTSPLSPVLDLLRTRPRTTRLSEVVLESPDKIACVEAGGPTPGLGCAGRGIAMVLEYLEREEAYTKLGIDCVLYDVLGDVVCGGFSTPMRKGFADHVLILTSGEGMSLFAARNIAQAVQNFKGRGYATLGGLILNRALNQPKDSCEDWMRTEWELEQAAITALTKELSCPLLGTIHEDRSFREAERMKLPLLQARPESRGASEIRALAARILDEFGR